MCCAVTAQEYDRHLAAVNTITFVDKNRRFVSTSDDKSMRVWEWNIPVDMKYIADPSMHSMPAVTPSPNGKWIACQSLDNRICVFQVRHWRALSYCVYRTVPITVVYVMFQIMHKTF